MKIREMTSLRQNKSYGSRFQSGSEVRTRLSCKFLARTRMRAIPVSFVSHALRLGYARYDLLAPRQKLKNRWILLTFCSGQLSAEKLIMSAVSQKVQPARSLQGMLGPAWGKAEADGCAQNSEFICP